MSNNARRFQRESNTKQRKLEGTSPHQPKAKFEEERKERSQQRIQPKTNKQKLYQHMLESLTLIVADGPAGVGKSLLPCNHAANLMLAKKIEQIVLVRPYAATGSKTMGYNKGNLTDKIFPFMLPMIGYIRDVLGSATVDIMMEDGRILIQPLETIRGQSFKNAYVIADEMQSAEIAEIQALTTRIGEDCTLVICGDKRQNDVKKGVDGITYIKKILDNHDIRDSGVIEFTMEDCVRSGICKDFLIAYEKEGWV